MATKPNETLVSWEEKAAFMRRHRATHATWDTVGDLLSLTLSEQPPPLQAVPTQPTPIRQPGPAQRMAESFQRSMMARDQDRIAQQRHQVMFAASSVRPRIDVSSSAPRPDDVPRAVRAKQEAVSGGAKKRRKR